MVLLVVFFCFASGAFAQLAANRDTPQIAGLSVGVPQGSNVVYRGAMVAVDANGVAVSASDAAGLRVIGRSSRQQDNTGSGYDDELMLVVERGVFAWENGGVFTRANIGDLAFVEDDETVTTAALATYDIIAGVIVDVTDLGVWVDTYSIGSQGAASLTTLATSGAATLASAGITGNATVGGTLGVTGASTLASAGVTGNAAVGGTLGVTGASTLASAGITGAATVGTTLGVTGVLTLAAAPTLTATTVAGVETVAMTNAPAAGDPVWATATIGTNSYVIPLFPAE
jgi:hypothetical protein